jgi:probable F420-dependent oxidoreductase
VSPVAGSSDLLFGLCLPNFRKGASREGMQAAIETLDRLGWASIWTTDHLLPDHSARAADYAEIFEAVTTLAWAAAITPRLRLGLSVLVVPVRNSVEQASTLATVDNLSDGRLAVGVGVGWNETEFANLGLADRFHVRGAYLDESIKLWRHLWGGNEEPFHGRFFSFDEFRFGPLPAQGAAVPIYVGGRDPRALERAGALADGYQSSGLPAADYPDKRDAVRASAKAAGRPEPTFQARSQVYFDRPAPGGAGLGGSAEAVIAGVRAYRDAGVTEMIVDLREVEPEAVAAAIERFDREVVASFRR